MKIPTVDTFLCCMTLETGGIVMSWLHGIGSVIVFIVAIQTLNLLTSLEELCQIIGEERPHICTFGYWLILFAIFYMVLAIAVFVMSVWCMRGTYLKMHTDIKPMVIFMGISPVLSLFEMFLIPIPLALLKCIWYGYQFIVLYSLYVKYKDGHENSYYEQRGQINEETSEAAYQRISEAK